MYIINDCRNSQSRKEGGRGLPRRAPVRRFFERYVKPSRKFISQQGCLAGTPRTLQQNGLRHLRGSVEGYRQVTLKYVI